MGLASPFHYLFCTAPAQTDLDGALPCFDRSFCKKSDLDAAVLTFYYSFCKKIGFRCGCVEVLLFVLLKNRI